ncbi:MAG TPA: class I SAM-dependent methyltransferase [Pyrinomonadaceae bacterium]|nr:class I SAM-dependent methyltransferase [Pyrinomonadaceae bacterium]
MSRATPHIQKQFLLALVYEGHLYPPRYAGLTRQPRRHGMHWLEIDGWFQWRSAQEEAAQRFPEGSCFVEVGTYLGRSLCSLGEVVEQSGKTFTVIGVDTCRGSGPEGRRQKDYHDAAVAEGGGSFAGTLHKNVLACGYGDVISLVIADSVTASRLFADASVDWVHLDARHDYASVKADIQAWLPKVKPGGWLSGDDYDELKWPEVVKAVAELLPGAKAWSNQQWRWIVT